jgi:hypothetical protein
MATHSNSPIQGDSAAVANSRNCERDLQPTLSTPPVVETEFAEIADGSLVEMIEDPEDSARTLLAVYKGEEVRYASRVQSGDRVLVPIPRNQHIIKHVRLPRGAKPCESARSLVQPIESIFSQCLELRAEYTGLLTFFVLSTWFIDQLPVAPYVALVGLPRSGKSTALSLLRLLCRRALLTADITSAAFYRVCDRLTPTLLIDETGTAGERRVLFHLLRTGTTRDVVAIRKQESFRTFGAKAVSWIELPNDAALNSRCLLIPLQETHRTDLKRPWDPEILQAADELQKQLLYLRFAKYRTLTLPKIPGNEQLHSRARDLYESLALPCDGDTTVCEFLLITLKTQQQSNREPLTPSQSAVLRYLFWVIHRVSNKGAYGVSDLTNGVNSLLQAEDEHFHLNPRQVGSVLSSLGLTNRARTNHGWTLWLDLKGRMQIHELIAAYGVDNRGSLPTEEARKQCDLCEIEEEPKAVVTSAEQTGNRSTDRKQGG